MSKPSAELVDRLSLVAASHGPELVRAATAVILPSDSGVESSGVRELHAEAAAILTRAAAARATGAEGEAIALELHAEGRLRTAVHMRNLGAIEVHQAQAQQLREQALRAGFAVLRVAGSLALAAGV